MKACPVERWTLDPRRRHPFAHMLHLKPVLSGVRHGQALEPHLVEAV